jgi:hypothetical protein
MPIRVVLSDDPVIERRHGLGARRGPQVMRNGSRLETHTTSSGSMIRPVPSTSRRDFRRARHPSQGSNFCCDECIPQFSRASCVTPASIAR